VEVGGGQPTNLRVESERLEAFVSAVVIQDVHRFPGRQTFKIANLDPGPVKLTLETKEGKKHLCWFLVAARASSARRASARSSRCGPSS